MVNEEMDGYMDACMNANLGELDGWIRYIG